MRPKKVVLQPGKKRIGYARVSTIKQNIERQVRALKKYRCDVILADTASGKTMKGRPELERALEALAPGDTLVVAEWDRATRSMFDGLSIIERIIKAEATIKVLDFPQLDLETPEGRGFIALFSAMAEKERERIIKRTHEGRKIAQENGVKMGRKPKLTEHQRDLARQRLVRGEKPALIARDYNVSRVTISRLGYKN